MKDLIIKQTKDTLGITCHYKDAKIRMEGISYPEDAIDFFDPVYDWIESYIQEVQKNIKLEFIINYLNSSSTKCFFDFFEMLDEYHNAQHQVTIDWYYKKNDIDIKETGEEFSEDLKIKFNIIEFE